MITSSVSNTASPIADWIAWKLSEPGDLLPIPDTLGLLDRFIRLGDETQVPPFLNFVEEFGGLELCRHLAPLGRWDRCAHPLTTVTPATRSRNAGDLGECCPSGLPHGFDFWVPIEAIRHYARQYRAMLRCGARLNLGRPVDHDDWEALSEWTGFPSHGPDEGCVSTDVKDIAACKRDLASLVEAHRLNSPMNSTFTWEGEAPFGALLGGLSAVLLYQVQWAIEGQDHYLCDQCGELFSRPRRRPQHGREKFCDAHRKTGPRARYKKRQREAKRTASKEGEG